MTATASGRSEGMTPWFSFWETEQQQGRVRLETAMRRGEIRAVASRMEAIRS